MIMAVWTRLDISREFLDIHLKGQPAGFANTLDVSVTERGWHQSWLQPLGVWRRHWASWGGRFRRAGLGGRGYMRNQFGLDLETLFIIQMESSSEQLDVGVGLQRGPSQSGRAAWVVILIVRSFMWISVHIFQQPMFGIEIFCLV